MINRTWPCLAGCALFSWMSTREAIRLESSNGNGVGDGGFNAGIIPTQCSLSQFFIQGFGDRVVTGWPGHTERNGYIAGNEMSNAESQLPDEGPRGRSDDQETHPRVVRRAFISLE